MRRARASQDQLALPGLLDPAPGAPPPDPRSAHACARCGWYRDPAAACPVCRHAAPRPDRPR